MNLPTRSTLCFAGCGATVPYRTSRRVYCHSCREIKRRERYLRAAAAQRRKRGVPEIKGRVIQCARCRCDVVLNRNPKAKYCPACYLIENGIDARRRSERKRATVEGREYLNAWHRRARVED